MALLTLLWAGIGGLFPPAGIRAAEGTAPACEYPLDTIPAPSVVRVGEFRQMKGYRIAPYQFSSPLPSGIPVNDMVQGFLYLPGGPGPHPAAVVLHNLLALGDARFERGLAESLARAGYVTVFMDLPFHLRRSPTGVSNGALFIRSDLRQTVRNVKQAAADASALVRWLSERPDVDPKRIGMAGVSMGGFITHLVMGQNFRVRSGVTVVAGGDVAGLIWKSHAGVARAVKNRLEGQGITREMAAERLAEVEPTEYANCIAPRPVLMVNATDDLIVPRSSVEAMARALGDPPQLWLPTNHFGIVLLPDRLYRLTRDFLDTTLSGRAFPRTNLRQYAIPAVKAGVYTGLESRLTAGVGVAYPALYTHRNRPLLLLDGIWTGRGIFTGFSLHLTKFLNAGAAWRLLDGSPRASLYASGTLAF